MNEDWWKKFYKNKHTLKPSLFAKSVRKFVKDKSLSVIDVGCGNGRDTYYLSKKWEIVGIDKSNFPKAKGRHNISFIKGDINHLSNTINWANLVYARFFIHSVDDKTFHNLLKWSKNLVAIEVRSDKDDSSKWTYAGHQRKLRSSKELIQAFWQHGYDILRFRESKGCAKYRKEDPVIIRIIAKKYDK